VENACATRVPTTAGVRRHNSSSTVTSSAASGRGEACVVTCLRPAEAVESSAGGTGNAVGLTSILNRGLFF